MTRKKKTIIHLILICVVIAFSKTKVFSQSKDTTIKVGLYSYEPYYYRDRNNNITGYYHDFLEILCKDANINYEYVNVNVENALKKLKNKEIDIILGANNIPKRLKGIYYSENHIGSENQCVYIKDMSINYGDLNYLKGKKLASIKGNINSSWLSESLKSKNINLELIGAKNLDDCIKMFENGEVDVISIPAGNNSLKNYNNIFKYSSGIVYIIGNEDSKDIINKFDTIINKKYKSQYYNKLLNIYIYHYSKKIIIKKIIRKNKENNKFLLYYQPIVNPENNKIVGFESLLRLKDKHNKILPPSSFIKNIEESDMLSEMTLWILERAINDYKIMSNYDCCKDEEFYVSINLSFKELENEYFVDKVVQMAKDNNIKNGSIYLEILENICIEDLNKIKS